MTDWLQGKSAKQWVNEIGVKQLIRPQWETREAIPGQQPPTFVCRCVIPYSDGPLEAEAYGKTKKEAEQLAAVIMLKDKLKMTPLSLQALNNSSKRMSSSSSSTASRSSPPVGGAGGGDGGDVSDTDDKDAEARENPIGALMAVCDCDQNDFQEPEYTDVHSEGPPHRRIFTVQCTVKDVDDQEITFKARRYTKKHAKKIAAFRVLRKLNELGFTYTPHEENGDAGEGEDSVDTSTSSGVPDEVSSAFNVDDLNNGLDEALRRIHPNQVLAHEDLKLLKGRRNYCADESHKCLELCKDYPHAFAHLKKCESLDKALEMDNLDSIPEGPLALLQEIAREIEIKLAIANVEPKDGLQDVIKLLELTFPFDFKFPVPKKAVVHGIGADEMEAKENAAKAAINFLRNQLICAAD